jgi:malate dehydrogenase (oxaloacetate-decarboxylating)
MKEEYCKEKSSAGFSITVQIKIRNVPGSFARIVQIFAASDASLAEVSLVSSDFDYNVRQVTVSCKSEEHSREILKTLENLDEIKLVSWKDDTFEMHRNGKLNVSAKAPLITTDELSRAYTPGVARVCNLIHREPDAAYTYTIKGKCVAVVTDGSAVLGLGNIGPLAALPVMEGKAMLFKQFADIDAFPICLNTQDTEEIIKTVKNLSPVFGGINLEDISAPRCFEIESRLQKELDIPIFHDDQHGTAVVVLAGLINALKIIGKDISKISVVVNGFGAGGVACTRLMMLAGVKNVIACDTAGIVYDGRPTNMNPEKKELAKVTNLEGKKGTLADALKGADVFVGVSQPGVVTPAEIKAMAKDPIVFALANPVPEILPGEISGIARIIATGRSDYANQVNNVLCFPGIFKGAMECRAREISANMKIAAAYAIAESVQSSELKVDYIIPNIFKIDVASKVAERVKQAAIKDGVARIKE